MAMVTLNVNGNEVELAANKLQFGTPGFYSSHPLKIQCQRATTSDASKNAAAFEYEDMMQSDDAYVTPTYLAIKETEGSNYGIIAYSFTMKLTHRTGASSHDDQWYRFKLSSDSDSGIVTQRIYQVFVQKNRATANGNTGPFIVYHDGSYGNISYGYICCDNEDDESDPFYVDVFVVAYYSKN